MFPTFRLQTSRHLKFLNLKFSLVGKNMALNLIQELVWRAILILISSARLCARTLLLQSLSYTCYGKHICDAGQPSSPRSDQKLQSWASLFDVINIKLAQINLFLQYVFYILLSAVHIVNLANALLQASTSEPTNQKISTKITNITTKSKYLQTCSGFEQMFVQIDNSHSKYLQGNHSA